jgi:hypothetical protein
MSYQAGGQKLGGSLGAIGGGALGSTFGPVGTALGSVAGGYLGSAIGGGLGSLFGSSNSGPSAQQLQAMKDEQALRDRLTRIASGQGPSVAGLQLGQGLEQIDRSLASDAAGTRGAGGVLAHYGAMQAGANATAATNQAAAIARAQEIANANNALAGLTGSTLGTTTAANTAANALDFDKTKTYLGAGLQGATSLGAHLLSSGAPSAGDGAGAASSGGGSLNFTPPTDEDGVATLSL